MASYPHFMDSISKSGLDFPAFVQYSAVPACDDWAGGIPELVYLPLSIDGWVLNPGFD